VRLEDGSRVAIIGGGPAGAFSGYFLLQMAGGRDGSCGCGSTSPATTRRRGPRAATCAAHRVGVAPPKPLRRGIHLPPAVVQKRIDSYFLHMDVGSVRIDTPLQEKRIAAVYRGGGPKGALDPMLRSFDGYLLEMAASLGAEVREGARSSRSAATATSAPAHAGGNGRDLRPSWSVPVGVNTGGRLFEVSGSRTGRRRRRGPTSASSTRTRDGAAVLRQLDARLPPRPARLRVRRRIIPKGSYATVCLLGENVDKPLVEAFLDFSRRRECFPPHWRSRPVLSLLAADHVSGGPRRSPTVSSSSAIA